MRPTPQLGYVHFANSPVPRKREEKSTKMVEFPYKLPLPYGRDKCRDYESLAMAVLDQAFHKYGQFVRNELKFDVRKWRLVKRKEHLNVYAVRDRNLKTALEMPLNPEIASEEVLATADWAPSVKLCMTGTTMGSLEDCMYAACAATETAMLMKSLSIQDTFYHHKTLCDIRIPTVDEPFTYVGLKWSARSTYLGNLIKARDMTYVEASGFRELYHDGKFHKVGYTLYHSVNLPEVPALSSQNILRSRYSAIVLYRQVSPGVVEIFSTTVWDPAGDLPAKLTEGQVAEGLSSVCKITEYAMKKKLVWMQAARAHASPNIMSELMPPRPSRESFSEMIINTINERSKQSVCQQCDRTLSALRTLSTCEICAAKVCYACITNRKLVLGYKKEELTYKGVAVCKRCITTAQHMEKGTTLGVYEFVQPFDRVRSDEDPSTPMHSLGGHSRAGTYSTISSLDSTDISDMGSSTTTSSESFNMDGKVHAIPTAEEEAIARRYSMQATVERLKLWKQINELCVQAEQTYQLAVEQTAQIIEEREEAGVA